MGRVKKNKPRRIRPPKPEGGTALSPREEAFVPLLREMRPKTPDEMRFEDTLPFDPELGDLLQARGWVDWEWDGLPNNSWEWDASDPSIVDRAPTNIEVVDPSGFLVSFAYESGPPSEGQEMHFATRDDLVGALEWIEAFRVGDAAPVGSEPGGSYDSRENPESVLL